MEHCRSLSRNGLIVIRRINYREDPRFSPPEGAAALPLEPDTILERYRGIQGEPWSLEEPDFVSEDGVADVACVEKVLHYSRQIANKHACDVIYAACAMSDLPPALADKGFTFLGYDFGYYLSTWNCYSVLFNEVIYGSLPELRQYAVRLNESLLLPSLGVAAEIGATRNKLAPSEAGRRLESLEEGECFDAIAIFGTSRSANAKGTTLSQRARK
jgi:hypothetical protein